MFVGNITINKVYHIDQCHLTFTAVTFPSLSFRLCVHKTRVSRLDLMAASPLVKIFVTRLNVINHLSNLPCHHVPVSLARGR